MRLRPKPWQLLLTAPLLCATAHAASSQCTYATRLPPPAQIKPVNPPIPTKLRVSISGGTPALATVARKTLQQAVADSRMLLPSGSGLQAALDLHVDIIPADTGDGDEYLLSLVYHEAHSSPRSGSYDLVLRPAAAGATGAEACETAFATLVRRSTLGFLAGVQAVAAVGSPVTFQPFPPLRGAD